MRVNVRDFSLAVKPYLFSVRQRLTSQTGFLFFSTVSGYAFSYLYLVAMGRILSPEVYGILGALFAIFYITCLFGQALMEAIATKIAEIKAKSGEPEATGTFIKLAVRLGLLSLVPAVILIAISRPVASFFHLSGTGPVIILAAALFCALILHIVLGLLQGLQEFRYLGITGYLTAQGLKLLAGILFVLIGWELAGAIGALLASVTIASVTGLFLIRKRLADREYSRARDNSRIGSIIVPAFILAVFLAIPASVDVMLVTHYFGGREAGLYNAVATIGKVVVFLPMAVSFVLLPRVTEGHAKGQKTGGILLQSLLVTLVLSGIVAVVYWCFPGLITRIFFGDEYSGAGNILSFYTVVMLVFSINVVLMHYSLAVRKLWLMALADLITLLEVALIIFIHDSINQIIWILLAGNVLVLLISMPNLLLKKGDLKGGP